MRNSLKKFRIHRATNQQTPAGDPPEQSNDNTEPMDQKTRIEKAVRNRVARSLKSERATAEAEAVPEAPFSENVEPEEPEQQESALSPREEINLIKQENLTGRQLRIARRLAQKRGIQATSDLDAVRLLRKRGIDPFNRGEIMNTRNSDASADAGAETEKPVSLPATRRKTKVGKAQQPPPPVIDDDTREREIKKIQRDLVARRRRRLAVLMLKLACYVALPSILAGYYFYRVATPMYATYTEFVIQQADAPSAMPSKSLLSASPFAMVTDSIVVQGYLTSRDAMKRLDHDLGFRSLYQGDKIDALQRLADDATDEEAYTVYKKKVVIGYDPTEGVIKMEVISPSPKTSLEISRALITYAEERVDQQTKRMRDDTMRGAEKGYKEAEEKLAAAQREVADLQRKLETFDTAATFSMIQGQIGELESMILEKELQRAELTANPHPNPVKVRVLDQKIKVLERKLNEKKSLITRGGDGQTSIVDINAELTRAQANLELRRELLGNALAALENARVDANRQTRFLSMGVSPVQSDQPAYPRAFENTLLSIIVFAGLYLMLSLTISILREQVTT